MSIELISYLLLLLPALAALLVGLFTNLFSNFSSNLITCGAVLGSAICAFFIFQYVAIEKHDIHLILFPWIESNELSVSWGILIDPLVAVMLIVITWISSLVHIYSIGYMEHDAHSSRFMSYLSLFTFCMLVLVVSDNFLQLFCGWEGVGLSSYLLIGFWFQKRNANLAAVKAFLVNRVADIGLIIGILWIFFIFGTLDFIEIFDFIKSDFSSLIGVQDILMFPCLLLFIGAMGKSAQIFLHVWLPDAMEGPTPVSALIHAATMVTAGVFLLARCSPLFELTPIVLDFITVIGAITCLFAASIALVQNDIKKIIAYSTCSQLGYMFFACGSSAYAAAIFHLMTHAFFKALLFLGAGSVIHIMSEEQDIYKMGGIKKVAPITYVVMWIGSLALAGIYPFAGFYSKDLILEAVYISSSPFGKVAYYCGILAAILTAFYSWRLLILVFEGKSKASPKVAAQAHESPIIMLLPLLLLSVGAIFSGIYGKYLGMDKSNSAFWRDSIYVATTNDSLSFVHDIDNIIKVMPLIAGLMGIFLAYTCYHFKKSIPHFLSSKFSAIYLLLVKKYYFDEIYDYLIVENVKRCGKYCSNTLDLYVIDGFPNGIAAIVRKLSSWLIYLQSGYIYRYLFAMSTGIMFLLLWVNY